MHQPPSFIDDEEAFFEEGVFGEDGVVEGAAFKEGGLGEGECVGLEGAGAGAQEDGFGEVGVLFGGDAVAGELREVFECLDSLAEVDGGVVLEGLFDEVLREVFGEDLGEAGDVVDIFFGVEGGELPAEDVEGVDELGFHVAEAGVEGGEEADGAGTDDGEVEDVGRVGGHEGARI